MDEKHLSTEMLKTIETERNFISLIWSSPYRLSHRKWKMGRRFLWLVMIMIMPIITNH